MPYANGRAEESVIYDHLSAFYFPQVLAVLYPCSCLLSIQWEIMNNEPIHFDGIFFRGLFLARSLRERKNINQRKQQIGHFELATFTRPWSK